MEDDLHDHARVLGVEVDLPARRRRLDQLGRADVLFVRDLEAVRLERLLVELSEDVLLGEVLRADDDGRPRLRQGACGYGKQAEGRRDGQRDRERSLPGHSTSFRGSTISMTLSRRRAFGVSTAWTATRASHTPADRAMTHSDAPITPSSP